MKPKRKTTKKNHSTRLEINFEPPLTALGELVVWSSAVQTAINLAVVDILDEDRERQRATLPGSYRVPSPEHTLRNYLEEEHPAALLTKRFDDYVASKYKPLFFEALAAA